MGLGAIMLRSDLPVKYVDHMGSDLMIARAAWEDWDRVFKSEGHAEKFFDKIVGEHHGSPIEFSQIVFHAEMPLFTATQLLRHRTMSFAGRSARYRTMLPQFYMPPRERPTVNTASKMNPSFDFLTDERWEDANAVRYVNAERSWEAYQALLAIGEAEEIARGELIERMYTGYSFCVDLRNILGFLALRVDHPDNAYPTHPQWEIEQIAKQVEGVIAELWPQTYKAFTKHGRQKP